MNLPITHSTDSRQGAPSRLAALALRSALVLSLVALGCGRGDKRASDSTTAAAAPGTTATDSGMVASASTGETAASTPTPRADSTRTESAAPGAASESTAHATDSAAAKRVNAAREHAAAPTHHAPARHEAPARQAPAEAPAAAPAPTPAAPPSAAATDTGAKAAPSDTGAKTAAPAPAPAPAKAQTASAPEKADSTCSTENGAAGVQPAKPGPDPLLVSQSEYDGWKMFHVYCYRCHGVDAMGGGIAPNLRHSLGPEGSVDHACFVKTVTEGRLPKGMPSWKSLLDSTQIQNIWHYLQARSSGRLAPGRPHTAGSKG